MLSSSIEPRLAVKGFTAQAQDPFAHLIEVLTSDSDPEMEREGLVGARAGSPGLMTQELTASRGQSPVPNEAAGHVLRRGDTTRDLVSPVRDENDGHVSPQSPATVAQPVGLDQKQQFLHSISQAWDALIQEQHALGELPQKAAPADDPGAAKPHLVSLHSSSHPGPSSFREVQPTQAGGAAAAPPAPANLVDLIRAPALALVGAPVVAAVASEQGTPFSSWASSAEAGSGLVSWPRGDASALSSVTSWGVGKEGARALSSWGSAGGEGENGGGKGAGAGATSSWPASSKWAGAGMSSAEEEVEKEKQGAGSQEDREDGEKTEEEEGGRAESEEEVPEEEEEEEEEEEGEEVQPAAAPSTAATAPPPEDAPAPPPAAAKGTSSSGAPLVMPQCGGFEVKAIATGICQLFPEVKRTEGDLDCIIDIDVLAAHCQTGASASPPGEAAQPKCSIVEVCGRACPKGGTDKGGREAERPSKRVKLGRTNRLNNVCAFKMLLAGGGDKVTLRLWANGKTQTSGCKNVEMLKEANLFICSWILRIHQYAKEAPELRIPPIFASGDALVEAALASEPRMRVLSAPILGSWDLNLRATHSKLNMTELCRFLSQPCYSDRVLAVKHVQPKGNSARFNNLSLYVRREALKTWPRGDNADLASLYVNVYEAGKCSVLAAPDHRVAEELTALVSDMLLEAYRQDAIRQYCPTPTKRRHAPSASSAAAAPAASAAAARGAGEEDADRGEGERAPKQAKTPRSAAARARKSPAAKPVATSAAAAVAAGPAVATAGEDGKPTVIVELSELQQPRAVATAPAPKPATPPSVATAPSSLWPSLPALPTSLSLASLPAGSAGLAALPQDAGPTVKVEPAPPAVPYVPTLTLPGFPQLLPAPLLANASANLEALQSTHLLHHPLPSPHAAGPQFLLLPAAALPGIAQAPALRPAWSFATTSVLGPNAEQRPSAQQLAASGVAAPQPVRPSLQQGLGLLWGFPSSQGWQS